jgi:hypothetical protein
MRFLHDSSNDFQVDMRVSSDADWKETTECFVQFLQACGYIVNGYDVAEYLMEQYQFQKPKEKQCQKVKSKK